MNELITLTPAFVNGAEIQTVDARELHAFLEVKSEFRNWIKNRINDFGFVENQDFCIAGKILPGGQTSKEYYVSLDMAKELSMVERSEKGKQARQYFIRCEALAKERFKPAAGSLLEDKINAHFAIARHMVDNVHVTYERAKAAALSAIKTNTGFDIEDYRALLPAVEPIQQANMNATAVGLKVGLSAIDVNKRLAALGLIEKDPCGKGWILTDAGAKHGEARPYVNNGHSGYDIKWRPSVLKFFNRKGE